MNDLYNETKKKNALYKPEVLGLQPEANIVPINNPIPASPPTTRPFEEFENQPLNNRYSGIMPNQLHSVYERKYYLCQVVEYRHQ